MQIRYEIWEGSTYYYTKYNKSGVCEVHRDEDPYGYYGDIPSEVVFCGTYDECREWMNDIYEDWYLRQLF